MTSPSSSSYVFYDSRNPLREHKVGTQVSHVFIADRKVTVHWNEFVTSPRSGVVIEKCIKKVIYSLHENSQGVKYLKYSRTNGTESCRDASWNVFSSPYRPFLLDKESEELVDKTLLSWFDYEYFPTRFTQVQSELFFPVFRDTSLPLSSEMETAIRLLPDSRRAVKALRENTNWAGFIENFCHPSVIKTKEDIQLIAERPLAFLLLAEMNLGDNLSSLYSKYGENFHKIDDSYSPAEYKLIRFMLKHLPSTSRASAIKLLVDITQAYDEVMSTGISGLGGKPSLSRVPVKLRSKLACALMDSLKETYIKLRRDLDADPRMARAGTELSATFSNWFLSNVLECEIAADKTTISGLEQRFFELFGTQLQKTPTQVNDRILRLFSKGSFTFAAVSEMYGNREAGDVFRELDNLVVKNRPLSKESGSASSSIPGYADEVNSEINVYGNIYLLADILNIIETGANWIDTHLAKLGRELTPENRVFFLSFNEGEGKLKSTWKYFDWGVTEAARTVALKKSKITKKIDVQTYNELPDEMFYELLALETGEKATPNRPLTHYAKIIAGLEHYQITNRIGISKR